MNEKPVKINVDFNEALRGIARADKNVLLPKIINLDKEKTTPSKKNGVVKVKSKQG